MKKAAEVDFTWAAFAGTYEKKVLAAIASQVRGKRLENLRHRGLYPICLGPRATGGIDAEWIGMLITAKQSFAAAPRPNPRWARGAFHEARWLTNDQHDDVTLSAGMFAVKDIFSKSRKCACGLVSLQLVSAAC